MIREAIGVAMISLVALIVLAIYLSNRRLRTKQESALRKPEALLPGELIATCFYVSTCFQSDPLKRVWAHGLGHRGKVDLILSQDQLGFDRNGEASFGVGLSQLIMVGSASATIDKGVEADGLVTIHWNLGDTPVLTNLRIVSPALRSQTQKTLAGLVGESYE